MARGPSDPKMRKPLLVLLRWKGDIVAAYDDASASMAANVNAADGVSVEVYDVGANRAALGMRHRMEWRPLLGIAGSAILHIALIAGILLAITNKSQQQLDDEAQNEQSAVLKDRMTRIAANETTKDQPKPEKQPPPPDPTTPPPAPAPPIVTPPPPPKAQKDDTKKVAKSPPDAAPEAHAKSKGQGGKDDISTSPSVCNPHHIGPSSGPMCTRSVTLGAISKRESCYVDTVAQPGDVGTLTYPCDGDGEATLTFGNKTFSGAVESGKVDVCTGTEYPFSDGCTWSSAQRISGNVAGGSLRFTYGEAPKPNQHECAQACGASATLSMGGGGTHL